MRFFGPALGAGPLPAEPLATGTGTGTFSDNWLNRLFRLAIASSAKRFDTRTGDGCRSGTGSATVGCCCGSSERVGEMLLSPALSLLMLLSPML